MSEKLHIYYYDTDCNIHKQIIDYREHWRGLETLRHATPFDIVNIHRMSNPYIYSEAGITEQDINDYEFANAVPATKIPRFGHQAYELPDGLISDMVDAQIYNMKLANEAGAFDVKPKQCTCDSRDLFNFGCKCGGI